MELAIGVTSSYPSSLDSPNFDLSSMLLSDSRYSAMAMGFRADLSSAYVSVTWSLNCRVVIPFSLICEPSRNSSFKGSFWMFKRAASGNSGG